ncbi:hypothetical protein [Calothrix sp. PCC 7507]|uniref:hypothetical protein n=1 Tax=Calothrix sp. PCC 7507 TaxID=99598 RepID=UPI00029ECA51|nr:hypothetical protein [Calothrix sp. PCC 7507]AFY33825.1 hypothetical protein Cal7507_3426 [Calothrix sp. PCC 7507]
MPQNTEYKSSTSVTQAISEDQPIRVNAYKKRLNAWAIARLIPDMERVIVARFRSRSDADGYLRHLRQEIPNSSFEVVVDYQQDESLV